MALTKYDYAISTGTLNGHLNENDLANEIMGSDIVSALSHVGKSGDQVEIWFKEAISAADQTLLTVIVASHEGNPTLETAATVIVKEEVTGVTGGHYGIETVTLPVDHAVNTWKDLDVTFPYPVSIFSAQFVCKDHHEGDIIKVLIAPETTIGALTTNVALGAATLSVQQSVLDNIRLGFSVKLDDGTNQDDLGECIGIDAINSTITVSTPTTQAFAAATPTYLKMTVNLVKKFTLPHAYKVDIGRDVIGGSLLPANTILRIKYKNVEGTIVGKSFTFMMEYKY